MYLIKESLIRFTERFSISFKILKITKEDGAVLKGNKENSISEAMTHRIHESQAVMVKSITS